MLEAYGRKVPAPEVIDPDKVKLVVKAHTVCRDAEGNIKWEQDIDPKELPMGTHTVMGIQPHFQVDTAMIQTGREHF